MAKAVVSNEKKGSSVPSSLLQKRLGDPLFVSLLTLLSVFLLTLVGLLLGVLVTGSWETLKSFGMGFIFSTTWDPVHEIYGALPFIFGTIVSSLLALLLAIPVGLAVAIFLAEICPPKVRPPLSFLVELLAAIPSVIYGLWGIFVLVPWIRTPVEPLLNKMFGFLPLFQGSQIGVGMLAGGIILAIMILPFIISVSREVLMAVPRTYREAALAVGATRWEVIRVAVLPYAKSGLIGAVFLALGRALGETMAVTMVIGNRHEIAASLFAPSNTMASLIANEFTEATSDTYVSALVEVALVLFGVTILINIIARWMIWKISPPMKGRMAE